MQVQTKMLSTAELAERTTATPRQIDWWIRHKVFRPTVEATGSGSRRKFSTDLVPPLTTLAKMSPKFPSGGLTCHTMRAILENHDDGELDLGDGVYIQWPTSP
jgi:hypothetical protein